MVCFFSYSLYLCNVKTKLNMFEKIIIMKVFVIVALQCTTDNQYEYLYLEFLLEGEEIKVDAQVSPEYASG